MSRKMLIDASHEEETRIAILNNGIIDEYDFETASKAQLKGNVYLAKVTRVEPSLQAAFIEYGGNRHGFLPFSEIHPDYFQVPVEDRKAFMDSLESQDQENFDNEIKESNGEPIEDEFSTDDEVLLLTDESVVPAPVEEPVSDALEESDPEGKEEAQKAKALHKQYKIQEVIYSRQIILVQVVKEERGNKGAALTTYLSFPGRYCVLMPNTGKGGGISRKVTDQEKRTRLKSALDELNMPEGMSLIVRTAGAERTKVELKRDFDYLLKLWNKIRMLTLKSTAPTLIYEEGNLIKKTLRDLYSKDIDEVLVEGEEGYKVAKKFMQSIMPSHAKRVIKYEGATVPLFHSYNVEEQLDAILSPVVQLPSGGYIVINPTEALVAIDVNSGRSTRERNIENTATRTNLEAATEISRQLRLRDLAGLIVIDFIDMDNPRNQAHVERRMREALKLDRSRTQMSRISSFGLMELSRQRLKPSLQEISGRACPNCQGLGVVRSNESISLQILRNIESHAIKTSADEIHVYVPIEVVTYLLNHKRMVLTEIEAKFELKVIIEGDKELIAPDFRIETLDKRHAEQQHHHHNQEGQRRHQNPQRRRPERTQEPKPHHHQGVKVEDAVKTDVGTPSSEGEVQQKQGRSRNRRRGGKRSNEQRTENQQVQQAVSTSVEPVVVSAETAQPAQPVTPSVGEEKKPSGNRRSRNRGRFQKRQPEPSVELQSDSQPVVESAPVIQATDDQPLKPKRSRRRRPAKGKDRPAESAEGTAVVPTVQPTSVVQQPKPAAQPKKPKPNPATSGVTVIEVSGKEKPEAPKKGWWRK